MIIFHVVAILFFMKNYLVYFLLINMLNKVLTYINIDNKILDVRCSYLVFYDS
jgi:hypothetical protein